MDSNGQMARGPNVGDAASATPPRPPLPPLSAGDALAAIRNVLEERDADPEKLVATIGRLVARVSPNGGALVPAGQLALDDVMAATAERTLRHGLRAQLAEFVFAYWQRRLDHTRAVYNDARARVIERALRENGDDVHELCYVIDGVILDPWPERRRNDSIKIIFRDRDTIERLAALASGYTRDEPHPVAHQHNIPRGGHR